MQPVGDNWIEWFKQTVHTPYDFTAKLNPPAELGERTQERVWGVPEGERNDSQFESLSVGDYILFYRRKVFFAVAEVSEKLRSHDAGEWIWENRASWNVFFLTNYRLLNLPRNKMWEYLDYKQNFDMRGFRRVPEDRLKGIWDDGYDTFIDLFDDYATQTPELPNLEANQRGIGSDWENGSLVTREINQLDVTPTTEIDELIQTVITNGADSPSTYWVNQGDEDEIKGVRGRPNLAYVSASVDNVWHHDLSQLETGDILFHYYDGALIGLSRVLQSALILKLNGQDRYVVPVDLCRVEDPISKAELTEAIVDETLSLEQLPLFLAPKQGYLIEIDSSAASELLQRLVQGYSRDTLTKYLDPLRVEIDLPDKLYFDDAREIKHDIEASLNSGKHVILTGPPGTGKSKIAKSIAEQSSELEQVDGYRFVTATSDMTTYDTIGGYVPNRSAEGDELEFRARQFLSCFRDDGVKNDWLIIDEINRADIDKAFGQLFSVLSGDSVELPYDDDGAVQIEWVDSNTQDNRLAAAESSPNIYPVTPSWRLLATMNTQDKASLYEMSFAFMRRFNFIHIGLPELSENSEIRASLLKPGSGAGYADGWINDYDGAGSVNTALETGHADIAVLWATINEKRPIGPSIVKDIAEYVAAHNGDFEAALTRATVSLVFPQLEGLRPDEQVALLRDLNTESAVDTKADRVTPALDFETLYAKADDFFGIEVTSADE
ncbi:hypothetical protein AUR64_03905 [Haloprofundus marisrubri]|uniref:AAA+ ATPase domain-containing protein n=2 Tax=Haloprofundus marisrubri TaxID=1514971 RepID=A0A0W1RE40_9EURY|nr:hypothetical protein AUR64_03905 [Haloprofundus marisrubri]